MYRSRRRAQLLAALVAVLAGQGPIPALAEADPANERSQMLYALGAAVGQQLAGFALSGPELDRIVDGFGDALKRQPLEAEPDDYRAQMLAFQQERVAAIREAELAETRAYLEEIAAREGFERSPSGMLYSILEPGEGAAPVPTSRVLVHYQGTLPDGTVFDSSHKRGSPAEFPLDRVIKCWTEGLQHLRVGGKANLVCPPDIAYGVAGHPPTIPPNAALTFDVELLAIDP